MNEESSHRIIRMAEVTSPVTSTSGNKNPDHPTEPSSQTVPLTVIPSLAIATSEEGRKDDVTDLSAVEAVSITGASSELHERKQYSRQGSILDREERLSVFDVAYPKDAAERSTLSKRVTDLCFRKLGLCSHPIHPKIQTPAEKPTGISHGVWSSDFHSMSMKLAVYIGTTEYILGPRLAWHYGGFIFYFVVFFLILISSFPANVLEALAGQYAAKSVVVFLSQLGPLFRGLGYAILTITGLILVFYAVHVANVLMYAYHAVQDQASTPWHNCSPEYNSKHCFLEKLQERCKQDSNSTVYYDFQCVPAREYCRQNGYEGFNETHCFNTSHRNLSSRWMVDYHEEMVANVTRASVSEIGSAGVRYISSRDFLYHYIHGEGDCKTNRSLPVCRNHARAFAVAYCAVWFLALLPCFNLWVASSFAVVVIFASPLVSMLVMTRVLLFPGAWAGVSNFFFGRGSLRQLLMRDFWVDACGLTFWSVVVGTGVVPTLSSRDKLRHGALRSSAMLVSADVAFGLLNSILLFAVRGHLELSSGFPNDQLRQLDNDSEGLVFVAFTTITDGMPRPRFWGTIYFGTMAAQSMATLTVFIVSVALNFIDAVPSFRNRPFILSVAAAGSPFMLTAAVMVISVLNDVRFSLYPLVRLQLAFVQLFFLVVVGFKLSKPEFRDQVQLQTGIDVRSMWRRLVGCWLVVCPLILIVEIFSQLMAYRSPPIPPGGLATAVFYYTAVSCPLLALIAGGLYSMRTTPFWELCSTSQEFGTREAQPRRPSEARSGTGRGRKASGRRSTAEGALGQQLTPSATGEEKQWELAKRSTLLTVV